MRFRKTKRIFAEVEPDEIFLDARNLPEFDTQQFEGRMVTPISKGTLRFVGGVFFVIVIIFCWRVGMLSVVNGEAYYNRSVNNTLDREPIIANRGIIYDRNNVPLAWNTESTDETTLPHRAYTKLDGFGHLLGYVSYPTKDKSGNYWQEEFIGRDGVEKQYNVLLAGKNGLRMIETDVQGKVVSENLENPPQDGANLVLSVDSRVQQKLSQTIASYVNEGSFTGGAGILMDVYTGELLAITSVPEYNSDVLSDGSDREKINGYLSNKNKPFINRAIAGLYSPGSIEKIPLAIGALNEGIITPEKQILSTGSISIPNPYFPDQKTVFKDWRVNGWTDMREAIAVSSDVYFYAIGGGYQDQKGLGIANIDKYTEMFGITKKTGIDLPSEAQGVLPTPEWKLKVFKGDPWRIGDTYHTAIGQYGFQVTPIQMVRAAAAVANNGMLYTPTILKKDKNDEVAIVPAEKIDINPDYFQVAREGMRQAVTSGTAGSMNVPQVKVAAKTGTAQVGLHNEFVNSWSMGFFPYENPKYAFVILMEAAPKANAVSASTVMRQLFDFMSVETPEYLK